MGQKGHIFRFILNMLDSFFPSGILHSDVKQNTVCVSEFQMCVEKDVDHLTVGTFYLFPEDC